ncbi:uroporphyrinogen-III C-methyltransferase [Polynucleobacter sp. 30F-ANTBAC]|jgi:uroporphyrin-III C-methyltransferase|uniref:uroporphyrinogen-III C-methyltransferase n=1 Tax=Polynucleobacter sp. 30F-ANTBAC TaxID=2689095 RepID=UPI001C0E5DC6|nr:uroporphyrinogen-III C-methyltransferase [Polynucleobacter sp. 30F-ANTBAC]MBU3599509.1 uroporphyrinogen-III C-methyltransferase [Polynucleobacter sp. 30F-ANTBAC]
MTNVSKNSGLDESKKAQSDALGKGLWKALWIAIAICILWLVIEGGLRLYHRPALLDARVADLERKIANVEAFEAKLESSLNNSLESQKNITSVANKISDLLNGVAALPMTASPTPVASAGVAESQNSSGLKKVVDQIKLLGDRLVRVQVVGDVKDVALTPAAQDLIRQQLKLHLVSARLAWLSNLPQVCKEDLSQARAILAKHFQGQATQVVKFENALSALQAEVEKTSAVVKGQ